MGRAAGAPLGLPSMHRRRWLVGCAGGACWWVLTGEKGFTAQHTNHTCGLQLHGPRTWTRCLGLGGIRGDVVCLRKTTSLLSIKSIQAHTYSYLTATINASPATRCRILIASHLQHTQHNPITSYSPRFSSAAVETSIGNIQAQIQPSASSDTDQVPSTDAPSAEPCSTYAMGRRSLRSCCRLLRFADSL